MTNTDSSMATAAVQAQPVLPSPNFEPPVQDASRKRKLETTEFDANSHLAYKSPAPVLMMEDIGYAKDSGVSPVAVSQPFQLFSPEAIQKFREEVFQPEVMQNYLYESNLAPAQIRGYAKKHAPFTYGAWHSPETLKIISQIAGVDLIPCMDLETSHVNLCVKSSGAAQAELDAHNQQRKDSHAQEEKPIVGWHRDSYPFVCVTMLSDCTSMVGGETALRTGDGEVMKVRGPQMGCAVVLQGRYITHQALRALGAQERITMVTSFRPKDPQLADDTVLSTVRGISDLSQLYYEFGSYRLKMVEARIQSQLKKMKDAHAVGKKTDTKALKAFMQQQIAFLEHTDTEMVPDEEVRMGELPELDIPNEQTPPPEEEIAREVKRAKQE